jgi:hypothetical protein
MTFMDGGDRLLGFRVRVFRLKLGFETPVNLHEKKVIFTWKKSGTTSN